MITLETLANYGADVETGLNHCMGNRDFYVRLVRMELGDRNFEALYDALSRGDSKAAFEAAHALKGTVGNLALTPLYDPICELTELLRHAEGPVETGDLPGRIDGALQALRALAEE